ncbi:PfkB family kinase [Penicillium atrosanguineum]|nr:PfkB family kinase [Penicillium atrosanguineum]
MRIPTLSTSLTGRDIVPEHEQDIFFTSLGLAVLDEIRVPGQEPLRNILGGSGTYATLGARLFLPGSLSPNLGWMIRVGNDFPIPVEEALWSWNPTLVIQKEPGSASTRGLLEYRDTTFGRIPLFSLAQDIKTRIANLYAMRQKEAISDRPLIIWEPSPLFCNPNDLQECLEAASIVDVFSPNHIELARLFSVSLSAESVRRNMEDLAARVLERGVGPDSQGVVIIRAGEHGCYVSARGLSPKWLPPYYGPGSGELNVSKVVDPTGAGNTFLGAYAIGYVKTGNVIDAACYGSVGASFAIEQVGIPEIKGEHGREVWNGISVYSRLHEYMSRII